MRIAFVGQAPSVVVAGPDGVDIEFPHGAPIEVPEKVGIVLLRSSNFRKAETRGTAERATARHPKER